MAARKNCDVSRETAEVKMETRRAARGSRQTDLKISTNPARHRDEAQAEQQSACTEMHFRSSYVVDILRLRLFIRDAHARERTYEDADGRHRASPTW